MTTPTHEKTIGRTLVLLGTVAWVALTILVGLTWLAASDAIDAARTTKDAVIINKRLIRENHRALEAIQPEIDRHAAVTDCRDAIAVAVESDWRRAISRVLRDYITGSQDLTVALADLDASANINVTAILNARCPQ